MDKISTDGEEQLPSSPTGGLPNLQPSKPYLQKAAIQPYRRPAQSAAKQPLSAESSHPALPEANPLCRKYPNPAANHPNPTAEAYAAAEAIIRDYGITN